MTTSSSSSSEKSRAPRTAASLVSTSSSERWERSAPNTMWTMCRSPARHAGAIDSATAIGPSSGKPSLEAELLLQLATQRSDQRLAAVHATPGQQPVLAAGLLLPAEEDPVLPVDQRRDPDARRAHAAVDPKPRTPRSDSGSSSTSIKSTSGTGRTTSWAIRIPGRTTNASRRSVFSRATLSSPR